MFYALCDWHPAKLTKAICSNGSHRNAMICANQSQTTPLRLVRTAYAEQNKSKINNSDCVCRTQNTHTFCAIDSPYHCLHQFDFVNLIAACVFIVSSSRYRVEGASAYGDANISTLNFWQMPVKKAKWSIWINWLNDAGPVSPTSNSISICTRN